MAAAKKVADSIGTVHHEINYTVQEGLDAIRDVIYYIETYDVTTVRASTPMYLLARVIKSMGIKMVLSGEGADEVFGGYLYFHKAPDAKAFHEETLRKISKLYLYDCLRANKSLAAWGVEGRVPFLDKEFMDAAMRLNPEAKMAPGKVIEKKILREAFEDMLPHEIVWRQKEQFSDGVGYSWIDTLKEVTEKAVTDEQMAHAADRFPVNPPRNKEEYYYRTSFDLTPEELQNRRVLLNFDVVGYDAKVFLNDVEVGNHHGDFTPFKLDVKSRTPVAGFESFQKRLPPVSSAAFIRVTT